MDYTHFQKFIMKLIDQNKRLHIPDLPGMGLSVLPFAYAATTKFYDTIICVAPKAFHGYLLKEIFRHCRIQAKFLVGNKQPILDGMIIITPQTLKLRVGELCLITPKFIITYCLHSGWDSLVQVCDHAERVCILGTEPNDSIRSILQ